ncbi:hypothetical protein D3C73_685650 [compost metagenome]
MANSYLRFTTEVNIVTTEVNTANIPKSSGSYNLANITLAIKGITCASADPENKVIKFLLKSFFTTLRSLSIIDLI